jgi:hypothetical protein
MFFSSISEDEIAMSLQHLSMKKPFTQGNSSTGDDDVCRNPSVDFLAW